MIALSCGCNFINQLQVVERLKDSGLYMGEERKRASSDKVVKTIYLARLNQVHQLTKTSAMVCITNDCLP